MIHRPPVMDTYMVNYADLSALRRTALDATGEALVYFGGSALPNPADPSHYGQNARMRECEARWAATAKTPTVITTGGILSDLLDRLRARFDW